MTGDPYKDMKITKGAVAKPGTTLVNKTGSWRSEKPIVDNKKCIGCGRCAKFCPDMAIKETEEGKFEVDLDYCKGCGICAEECPVKAITMEKEDK